MAAETEPTTGDAGSSESEIERGTYEVIRGRLLGHGRDLATRAEALNERRIETFGGSKLEVVGTERVRTENNCVPRDILAIGDRLLFGYEVFLGLKTETRLEDVFSLQGFRPTNGTFEFSAVAADDPHSLLSDSRFTNDFGELYRYYKNARLVTLRRMGDKVLAIFQVGRNVHDVKGFRWVVSVDGTVTYLDNQGDRDHKYPASHDFEWTAATRDDHVSGTHPHVNVLDEVFVETVGGDLTVKIEDNTEDGLGVYREPVEDENQALDDARIEYVRLGSLILVRVLPFHEEHWRYLVFNRLTRTVTRIDNIGQACIQLPEDHGIIFPGGYYLQRGETKTYDSGTEGMQFARMVRSPNGEDVLYVFCHQTDGVYVLLPYNLIRKEVDKPIHCQGYCLFDDGKMIVFRSESAEPTRVHPMQVWQTPFTSDVFADARKGGNTPLERIGNADLVRGISDSLSIRRMTDEQAPTRQMYEALIAETNRVLDSYHWLDQEDVGDLASVLKSVRATAELVVDEFEKVQALRGQATRSLAEAHEAAHALFATLRPDFWKKIDEFVDALSALRRERGRLITLREIRYMDLGRVEELEEEVVQRFSEVSRRAVEFLVEPAALAPYHARIAVVADTVETVSKVAATKPLFEDLEAVAEGLALLTEVVGGLEIEDATVRTRILEGVSEVMSGLNRTRALLQSRRRELLSKEGVAEFGAQFTLFSQSVTSALSLADSPQKCDEQLSKLLLHLEELEGRFGDFDQFLEKLATKREEVYEAVNGKKQVLLDRRQRRARNLMNAVERLLAGIARRASGFDDLAELNAYFASDSMVMKVRDFARRLREIEDTVKADEAQSRLKSAREDAVRVLRDRRDIFESGGAVIRLGRHRFSVNTQALELTMVPSNEGMAFHLTGTDFHETLEDEDFAATRPFWDQDVVSETAEVYRGEYLAACVLLLAEDEREGLSIPRLTEEAMKEDGLLRIVREVASTRYDEGYERGVHDSDGALILSRLLSLYATAGLLRYAPGPRAMACLFWAVWKDDETRAQVARRGASLGRLRTAFRHSTSIAALRTELAALVARFFEDEGVKLSPADARVAGAYLFEELARDPVRFTTTGEAVALRDTFLAHLKSSGTRAAFEEDLGSLEGSVRERLDLARAWVTAWLDESEDHADFRPVLEETVVLLLTDDTFPREVSSALSSLRVEDLLGQHRRIDHRQMTLRLDEFLDRLGTFANDHVPGFRAYQAARHRVLERERARLRLSEYEPKVMSSFVRNRLIDSVYLPLIGDNLAKQLGALGEGKRTDLMGMLLLISPPGYGKTTLMEYVASRLGLVFMKVNGPALGHGVRSLDPTDAPNATARQEVEKINLSFEMGNNVLLYLDDIQHTHPELLQKFISLCDGQRRVEGVWKGRTRTYDLRGKKFVVCMAGNPYTESGEKFAIPDMLANRADVYNLGDVLGGRDDLFALSYIENALTSNRVLAQITTHELKDLYPLVRMAQGQEVPSSDLVHPYSQVELEEILSVLRKMLRVQEVLLAVNREYIASASMDDAFRTEPPFKLQGSYRNMNKLAERIAAVMNDEELESLLADHYVGEAQTLTSGAEHNLLKFAELRGVLAGDDAVRWTQIRDTFRRRQLMGGEEDDPVMRVTGQLVQMSDRLDEIGDALRAAGEAAATRDAASNADGVGEELGAALAPYLDRLQTTLTQLAMPAPEPAAPQVPAPASTESDGDSEDDDDAARHSLALASRQAEVIEVGMLPILRSMNENLKISAAVWKRLDDIVVALKKSGGGRRRPAKKPSEKSAEKSAKTQRPRRAPKKPE